MVKDGKGRTDDGRLTTHTLRTTSDNNDNEEDGGSDDLDDSDGVTGTEGLTRPLTSINNTPSHTSSTAQGGGGSFKNRTL